MISIRDDNKNETTLLGGRWMSAISQHNTHDYKKEIIQVGSTCKKFKNIYQLEIFRLKRKELIAG